VILQYHSSRAPYCLNGKLSNLIKELTYVFNGHLHVFLKPFTHNHIGAAGYEVRGIGNLRGLFTTTFVKMLLQHYGILRKPLQRYMCEACLLEG
jgi:hypothetical protein